ncbi:MAG: hypothetical protein N3A65_07615 [candidate division WOR-3 bacterium]|nr:hypothetical protein [candidate division WOR-3 bacterium]
MTDNNKNTITLYPSNWLYNAGVVGFLRVLEELKVEYQIEECAKIELDKLNEDKIFEVWHGITKDKLQISYKGKSRGTQRYYYANQTEKSLKNKIKTLLQINGETKKGRINLCCAFCGYTYPTTKSKLKVLNQTYGNVLLGSEKSFPNTYWMLKSREFICSKCEFIIMCHHIPFIGIGLDKAKNKEQTEIFLNTPFFILTKDLNQFAENFLKREKENEIRKLFASTLIQWAIKRRALLGAWTIMNIEVIVKRRILVDKTKRKWETIIDYFDLPYHITRILLDYEIANLINMIGEEKIFDLIVSGKFSELEKANYFVLRSILKLKNKEKISENDPVTKYVDNYRDLNHLAKVSSLLPELYAKIIKTL